MSYSGRDDVKQEDRYKQTSKIGETQKGGVAPDYPTLTLSQQEDAIRQYDKHSIHTNRVDARTEGNKAHMAATSSDYKSITSMMTQLHEAMNANQYIMDSLQKEFERVRGLDSEATKEVYKTQQRQLLESYNAHYSGFVTKFIVVMMVGVALLSMAVAGWMDGTYSTYVMAVIVSVIVIIFAVTGLLMFSNNASRRKFHWNHYYWGTMDSVGNAYKDVDYGDCET